MNEISNWIFKYCKKNKMQSLVVGISGGIDSALVSTLCAETMMPTFVLSMPILQNSEQLCRADNHAKWLLAKYKNVTYLQKDLTSVFNQFTTCLDEVEKNALSLANSRSRLRMIMLYQIASIKSGIVVGTGNKVEDFGIGFFTKYGDGGVDISPIGDLMKSEVKAMAKSFGINQEILDAAPTDGLWDDARTDEQQIGATYDEMEWAMQFDGNKNELTTRQKDVLSIYKSFNNKNKHKMKQIPVFRKKNAT
jgi:NAD+ synthase